jgi:hypothetical protein
LREQVQNFVTKSKKRVSIYRERNILPRHIAADDRYVTTRGDTIIRSYSVADLAKAIGCPKPDEELTRDGYPYA